MDYKEVKEYFRDKHYDKTFLVIYLYDGVHMDAFKIRGSDVSIYNGERWPSVDFNVNHHSAGFNFLHAEKTSYGMRYYETDDGHTYETRVYNFKYIKNIRLAIEYMREIRDSIELMKRGIDDTLNMIDHEWEARFLSR